jgi:hypothetical protein
MDGTAAIQSNLEALKRILAGLVAMAGLGSSPLSGEDARLSKAEPPAEAGEGSGPTLPRHLRLAVLRLLRPAEAAARRLIIASAKGLVVSLPPQRQRKPKPATLEPQLRRFGIAVVMSPADLFTVARPVHRSPLGEGGRAKVERAGGGGPRCLRLFDPPRRFRDRSRHTVPAHAAPRILLPGLATPHRLPPPPQGLASPDDPIDATRLTFRLAALAAALDDIEGQARRFARWKAFRERERNNPAPGRRTAPLRPGRPPGGRLARFDPSAYRDAAGAQGRNADAAGAQGGNTPRRIREVDEILAHAHALALHALTHPDTS